MGLPSNAMHLRIVRECETCRILFPPVGILSYEFSKSVQKNAVETFDLAVGPRMISRGE